MVSLRSARARRMGDQPNETCYEAGARADATDSHRLLGCGQARDPHQLLLIGLQAVMVGGSTTRLVLDLLGSPYGRFFDRQVQHRIRHDSLVAVQLVGSPPVPLRNAGALSPDSTPGERSAPVSGRFRAGPPS